MRVLRERPAVLALVALCMVALLLALVLWRTFSTDSAQLPPVDVEAAVVEALNSLTPSPPVSVQVYQSILRSLVIVQTDEEAEVDRFGIGSGVVINSDANVLTAFHVVEGARDSLNKSAAVWHHTGQAAGAGRSEN